MPDISIAPPRPAAILFDCDGTLLLTGDLHYTAFSQAVARQGLRMDRDWYSGLTGLGRADLLARFAAECDAPLDLTRAIEDSIALTVTQAHGARENPSVAALARLAAGRLPIAVVTNSEAVIAHAMLDHTRLRPLFDLVLTCEDAARPKPAPDLYLAAAERIGRAARDCIVVEDSDQGLAAAAAAGMRAHDIRRADWPAHCLALSRSLAESVAEPIPAAAQPRG